MNVDAKLFFYFHNSGLAWILTNFAAVYRDEHIWNSYFCSVLQNRNGFTNCGSSSDNVLDDDDAVAVFWLIANQVAAFTVVFCFFTVKEVWFVHVVFSCKSACCRSCKRNTFVCRTKHCVKVFAAVFHDALSIEFTQSGNLSAGFVVSGVYKVWGESAAFCFKLAKTQNVCAHHKFDEFFFRCRNHDATSFT